MSVQNLPLIPGTLPVGYCATSLQDLYNTMFQLGVAVQDSADAGTNVIFSTTTPDAADRGKPWIKLNSDGSLDGIFVWHNGEWQTALPDRAMFVETYGTGTTPPVPVVANWTARALNATSFNSIDSAVLAANQITLVKGTYCVRASAPGGVCDGHQVRLANVTGAPIYYYGTSQFSPAAYNVGYGRSLVEARFTIGANATFELQHKVETISAFYPQWTFGRPCSFGNAEIYAQLAIEREQ